MMRRTLTASTILIALACTSASAGDQAATPETLVIQIQRAYYEGNRPELARLYQELAPFVENKQIASRVRYWRGFALWRRALNGFNESIDAKEQEHDLELANSEFKQAAAMDDLFVDAKIAEGSCLSNLVYLNRTNPPQMQEFISEARSVLKEAESQAPDNPRLAWVEGPNLWYRSQQNAENQAKSIELYERGLETIRKQKPASSDRLEPSWGEPELLMNLAWANLRRNIPDLKAAQMYAQSALKLVPYWHYVKDILMPQIQSALESKDSTAAQSR